MAWAACKERLTHFVPSYHSVKTVQVVSWKAALVYWTFLALVLFYIVLHQYVWGKMYQLKEPVEATITSDISGVAYEENKADGTRTYYDATELTSPGYVADSAFVATFLYKPLVQKQGNCSGNDPATESCRGHCVAGEASLNGFKTGHCNSNGFCELQGWCPPFEAVSHIDSGFTVKDWVVTIRWIAHFSKFKVKGHSYNALSEASFTVGKILELAGTSYEKFAPIGGAIAMEIEYDCDFDKTDSCVPLVKMRQKSSGGFVFDSMDHLGKNANGESERLLTKVNGMLLLFKVSGQGGQFSIVVFGVTLGASLGLLSIAAIAVDLLFQYILPEKEKFVKMKYDRYSDFNAVP